MIADIVVLAHDPRGDEDVREELLGDYEVAIELRMRLNRTPRRRWVRRHRIDRALREICARADIARHELGAPRDSEPTYEQIARTVGAGR